MFYTESGVENMNIAICDDNKEALTELSSLVEEAGKAKKTEIKIDCYLSGKNLLKDNKKYDAVFLDIEMPEIDGIDTGREIRKKSPSCILIMATAYENKFKEAFKIEASRYLTKPYEMQEVSEALDFIISHTDDNYQIEAYYQRNLCKISSSDISYIRSINGYCECYVKGKCFRKEETLIEMEKELEGRDFVRVHKSYMVNMRLVDDYADGVLFIGDTEIPVASRRKKNFEKRFITFDINRNV